METRLVVSCFPVSVRSGLSHRHFTFIPKFNCLVGKKQTYNNSMRLSLFLMTTSQRLPHCQQYCYVSPADISSMLPKYLQHSGGGNRSKLSELRSKLAYKGDGEAFSTHMNFPSVAFCVLKFWCRMKTPASGAECVVLSEVLRCDSLSSPLTSCRSFI